MTGPGGTVLAPPAAPQAPPLGGPERPRRWRGTVTVVLLVLLGGALVALLKPAPAQSGYLDPANPRPGGGKALASILAQRGQPVLRAVSVTAAEAAARSAAVTLIITSPSRLSPSQLRGLARTPASLLLVAPGGPALAALAPGVTVADRAAVALTAPGCPLLAARLAGTAAMGGVLMRAAVPGAVRCYPIDGHPSLVRFPAGGRPVTVLGTGAPFSNTDLGRQGDAALALNLLRGSSRIVWLVPPVPLSAAAAGPQSLFAEIPGPAYLVALQLLIAAVLAALWRARRLGPLVTEPLPVVVRAAETVEGHGRLYRSRRARDRAAAALRAAALRRITSRLALPASAGPDPVAAVLAGLTGRDAGEIRATLFGPVPRDDAALVALARDIDALEGEVRTP